MAHFSIRFTNNPYICHTMPYFYVRTQHPFIKYHKIIKKATVIYVIKKERGRVDY